MKVRETYEFIKNQKKNPFNIRVRVILLVFVELIISVLIALGLSFLLNKFIKMDSLLLLLIDFLFIILFVGILMTDFLSRLFFEPIEKLGSAIEKVADGDFSVRLSMNRSTAKEIQEIYSGFNLMVQELSTTEVLQTDFVSNVSHEFKTPINAIEGYATLLQDCDNFTEDQKEYVEKILFNTKRLSTLVGNILLLSKIENQSIQTHQAKFRLDEQIRQSIVFLEAAWTQKEIEFDVEMESIEYYGNESLLHHVWDNLIGNAIKFSPKCGYIGISLKKEPDHIIFTIEDSGPGISEEAINYIFDKFYQADSSHKEEGNGLGLALVKKILSIAGGEVYAQNMNGGGCKFTVIL